MQWPGCKWTKAAIIRNLLVIALVNYTFPSLIQNVYFDLYNTIWLVPEQIRTISSRWNLPSMPGKARLPVNLNLWDQRDMDPKTILLSTGSFAKEHPITWGAPALLSVSFWNSHENDLFQYEFEDWSLAFWQWLSVGHLVSHFYWAPVSHICFPFIINHPESWVSEST